MGFDLPHIAVPADSRADAARDENRREATKQTQADAESFAQSQANSYVQTHDRLTAGRVRELRQQIQNFAHQKNPPEQFTEQQITDIMAHVLDQSPARPGSNDPEVRNAAATPLPTEQPAEAPQGNSPQPNPDDPNAALMADHGDGTDGGFARLLSGNGNEAPNPQVLTARAALLPTASPPPPPPGGNAFQPPPPGVPLPTPKNPNGVPHDGAPQVAVGNPAGDNQVATLPGASLLPGAPVVTNGVVVPNTPVEPQPRVRVMCLGDPVKNMGGEEQQTAALSFVEARADFSRLTSTMRGPIPMPVPTTASQGETVVGRLFRQATAAKVGSRGGRSGGSDSDSTATDRDLALGFRRSMGRC